VQVRSGVKAGGIHGHAGGHMGDFGRLG
jgi:hypothetical protein